MHICKTFAQVLTISLRHHQNGQQCYKHNVHENRKKIIIEYKLTYNATYSIDIACGPLYGAFENCWTTRTIYVGCEKIKLFITLIFLFFIKINY